MRHMWMCAILVFGLSFSAMANDETIPFVVNEIDIVDSGSPMAQSALLGLWWLRKNKKIPVTRAKQIKIPAAKIANILKTLRHNLCAVIEDGQFAVSFSAGVSGKIFFGIGAKARSGFSVTVRCRPD